MAALFQGTYKLNIKNNVTIATTSTSVVSSAFGAQTYRVRISAPIACYVKIVDSTATTSDATEAYWPANNPEYLTVTPGQRVAVFSTTSTGVVSVYETT